MQALFALKLDVLVACLAGAALRSWGCQKQGPNPLLLTEKLNVVSSLTVVGHYPWVRFMVQLDGSAAGAGHRNWSPKSSRSGHL